MRPILVLSIAVGINILAARQLGLHKMFGRSPKEIFHERLRARRRLPASAFSWMALSITATVAAIWYTIHG
jgi:hypothetical protein